MRAVDNKISEGVTSVTIVLKTNMALSRDAARNKQ